MSDIAANSLKAVKDKAPLFRKWGIALIVIGVLAILFPLVFSIAAKTLLGWIFLLSGAAILWHAFQAREWRAAILSGIIALMHLVLGVYLGLFALTGLVGLTFLLGVVFLCQGGVEGLMAFQHRPEKGWGWLAVNGAATAILGVFLIAGLPGTAMWAIGLMLGLNFLMSGIALVALASAAEKQVDDTKA